jgi:hypothetical protein
MQGDWDAAVRTHYPYRSVQELERAWVQHVRSGGQPTQVASSHGRGDASPTSRVVVRQTAPPAQPLLEAPQPVYRGQAPEEGYDPHPAPRAGYRPSPPAQPSQGYRVPPPPPAVRLGAPEFEQMPSSMPQLGQPQVAPRSPVGYSP